MALANWIRSLGNAGAVDNARWAVETHRSTTARIDALARRIATTSPPRRATRRPAA